MSGLGNLSDGPVLRVLGMQAADDHLGRFDLGASDERPYGLAVLLLLGANEVASTGDELRFLK